MKNQITNQKAPNSVSFLSLRVAKHQAFLERPQIKETQEKIRKAIAFECVREQVESVLLP